MGLIRINPTKIVLFGDKIRAETFIGPAKNQMNILLQAMLFQKLSQDVRRVQLYKDVFVECVKCFNYQECRIYVTPSEAVATQFLIVLATGSGSEAVLWDMVSNTSLGPLNNSLNDIIAKLVAIDTYGSMDEAVYPETDSHVWTVIHPNDEHDSPLILPNYLSGNYGWELGYYFYMTYLYPSDFTYDGLALVDTVSWDFDYVDESPYPYPIKKQIDGQEKENDEKSSYLNKFEGRVPGVVGGDVDATAWGALVAEFETLTGISWPGNSSTDVWRIQKIWHPLFWYSMKDLQGSYQNLSTYGRGVLLDDTWADGEWSSGGDLEKSSLTWDTGGIATKTVNDNVESVLFEYVSVCHKFVDTYGTGMCDKEESDLDTYFRMYEHGKVTADSTMQEILDGTNVYRLDEGAGELVFNSILSAAAQRHANDMASIIDSNITLVDHTGTDGSSPYDRIEEAGYFTWIDPDLWGYKVSENIGWNIGFADPIQTALIGWKNSPEHWANMIDVQLSELGVGYAVSPGGYYVFVQNFGKVDHRYPGYSPFNTETLQAHIDENFIFDPEEEDTRKPRVYLIGSMALNQTQLDQLKSEEI